jgi:transcriptional regulator with XRE-family HTH domain
MRYQSIAEVCRGIGMNRQQFNKYLGGQALPNARTLKRLCDYFEIEETALFSPNDAQRPQHAVSAPGAIGSAEANAFLLDAALTETPDVLAGVYYCYFPLQGFEGFVVRSMLHISPRDGRFVFSRHTKISSPTSDEALLAFGKHRGLIVSNGSTNYLLGLNTVAPKNVSFMAIPKEPTGGTNLRFGLAVVHGISQPFSCQVCLEYLGKNALKMRSALNGMGILPLGEKTVPPAIAAFMRGERKGAAGQLTMPNFEGLLLTAKKQ